MTTKELIEKLKQYPEDMKVYVWAGNWVKEHQGEVKIVKYRDDMCENPTGIEKVEGVYLAD